MKSTEIVFVQSVRTIHGKSLKPAFNEKSDPRFYRTTQDGFMLDRKPGSIYGFYGYNNEGTADPKAATAGSSPRPLRDAVMEDDPSRKVRDGNNWRIEFVTAAYAKAGPDQGKIYGAVSWGIYVDAEGDMHPYDYEFYDSPPEYWIRAVKNWNAQAQGRFEMKNHEEQAELGPFNGINVSPPPPPPTVGQRAGQFGWGLLEAIGKGLGSWGIMQ